MNKLAGIIAISFILLPITSALAEKAPDELVNLANTELKQLGHDALIIDAVKKQNGKKVPLSKIRDLDEQWQKSVGIDDFTGKMLNSPISRHLKSIRDSASYYSEIFVVDNQGANVAVSDKTSDYWQGDEAKFTQCYNNGKGRIYLSDVDFDDSSQAYVVQISVPVMDGDNTIGVVVISVDIDTYLK